MIEIEDINDRDSLKQWLTDWPADQGLDEVAARAIAVSIAHRAAMRVLPCWWAWTLTDIARKRDLTALPILHCSLISGVAVKIPTPEIENATATAFASADASAVSASAAAAAFASADGAASAAFASAVSASASAASAAFATSAAAAAAFSSSAFPAGFSSAFSSGFSSSSVNWSPIRADCRAVSAGGDVFSLSLWAGQNNPLQDVWAGIKANVTDPKWAFWIKWYDDALKGNPPDWEMLEAIALIEEEVWDAGPEAVNARVAMIVERYNLAEQARAMRASLAEAHSNAVALAQRSHNNPPELVDSNAAVISNVEIIWAALGEAEEELANNNPSPSRLRRIGRAILDACKSIAAYCGDLGDIALKKMSAELGSAAGKWTIRGIVAYFAALNPAVQTLAGQILEFAEKLARLKY